MNARQAGMPGAPPAAAARRRPALKAAAGLLLLNGILNLEAFTGSPPWSAALRPAPEVFGLLAFMGLLVRRGTPFRAAAYLPAAAAVVLLGVFRLADALVAEYFSRPLNLYLDGQRLPDLVFLAWTLLPPAGFAAAATICGLGLAIMGWAARLALAAVHRFYESLALGPLARGGLAAATAALVAVAPYTGARQVLSPPAVPRLVDEVRFVLDLDGLRRSAVSDLEEARQRAARLPTDLGRLRHSPVFLFVVESYGRTALTDPNHARRVLPALNAAEAGLRAAGFGMCSAYLGAPTVGGSSWLTHATLASGIHVNSQIRHDLLLQSAVVPLADYFNRAGYRSVCAMPGTLWPWPQGGYYRYRRTYIAPDFDYRGPEFGWAPMPDQYVLDWIYRREMLTSGEPLFIEFVLVGSHADFEVQAPYIADWQRLDDGGVFHEKEARLFPDAWRSASSLSEAYSAAIVYELTVLQAFIRDRLRGGELVIVIGDHQPVGPVAGADRSASVPVHVISRSREFVRTFMERGYTAGLVPEQPLPHPGMESFFWDLLEGFSETEAVSSRSGPVRGDAKGGGLSDAHRSGHAGGAPPRRGP